MRNSDMPAMPVSVSQGASGDFMTSDDYGVGMGLTKREEFARTAMLGILSNGQMIDQIDDSSVKWLVESSVKAADALLAELDKGEGL